MATKETKEQSFVSTLVVEQLDSLDKRLKAVKMSGLVNEKITEQLEQKLLTTDEIATDQGKELEEHGLRLDFLEAKSRNRMCMEEEGKRQRQEYLKKQYKESMESLLFDAPSHKYFNRLLNSYELYLQIIE